MNIIFCELVKLTFFLKVLEDLKLYQKYLDLIYYSNEILKKYPKYEKEALVSNIKNTLYEGIKIIMFVNREKNKRMYYLNKLDINLKMLKVLVRVSFKSKYINVNNYNAYSKKITEINNLMMGFINYETNQNNVR